MGTRNQELRKEENRGYYIPEDEEVKPQKELKDWFE